MKRSLIIFGTLLICVAIYIASPYVALQRIAAAVEARNAAALSDRVAFNRLRRSLATQLVETYLKITGRDAKLGRFGAAVAIGTGATLADPIVAQILNSETLIDLLEVGNLAIGMGQQPGSPFGPLAKGARSSVWAVLKNSEFGFGNFHVSLPTTAQSKDRFRLQLRIIQWQWQLTAIDLPERLRIQLANELAKRIP